MKTIEKNPCNWRNNKWVCAAIPALLIHCTRTKRIPKYLY